jgi:outer membrane protein OmpA-like peptidoglycan-associated protein
VGRGAVSADRSGAVRSYPVTDLAETRRIDAMIRRNMAAGVQAKLTVGAPNDKYEQEADRVAEQVMGMPDAKPAVQRDGMPGEEEELQTKLLGGAIQREAMPEEEIQSKPLSATITPLVQREAMPEEEEEPIQAKLIQREAMPQEEEEIQTKKSSDGGFEAGGDFESRLSSSKSGGSPLPDDVRSFMEPRFGADFSGVRVHTGSEAVQMNREVGAQAFAHGQDVYYGAGKGPGKDALTAHELTHVVQQIDSVRTKSMIMRQDAEHTATPTDAGTTHDASVIPDDLRTFRQAGPYPSDAAGQTIVPPTGIGGFNARYDPISMVLKIVLNIAMTFLDGITISRNVCIAGNPGLQPLADRVNSLRGTPRQKALDRIRRDWQWHGDEDTWMQTYRQSVSAVWSRQHTFRSTHPGWESQLANVDVQVNTSKATGSGGTPPPVPAATNGPIHCQGTIYKTSDVPTDNLFGTEADNVPIVGGNDIDVGAEMGPGTPESGTDQTLTIGSDAAVHGVSKLTGSIFFGQGSAVVSLDQTARLDEFIRTFQPPAGGAGTTIDIVGRSNTRGGTPQFNQQLSERRAHSVADYLRTASVDGKSFANAVTRIRGEVGEGSGGASRDEHWRRAEISVAGGQQQNVAAHEFGHMIGLGDEYAVIPDDQGMISGTGPNVGDATAHDTLSKEMGLGGAVAENNDSIMSLGSTVRPQNYATFMHALHTVTGRTDWELKT